jgi:hypothetical protein
MGPEFSPGSSLPRVLLPALTGALILVGCSKTEKTTAVREVTPETPAQASVAAALPAEKAAESPTAATPATPALRVFGERGAVTLADVPAGAFHDQLAALDESARENALASLAKLHIPVPDVASLNADKNGMLFYTCQGHALIPEITGDEALIPGVAGAGASVPIATPPAFHSREGSTKVLYLDFNGATVGASTAWAIQYFGGKEFTCLPFDIDNDPTTFSPTEQTIIKLIWEHVAEDYAPFDIDVTTVEPATYTNTTAHALITQNKTSAGDDCPRSSTATGVAYLDVFGKSDYVSTYNVSFQYFEALVSIVESTGYRARTLAEMVSHEVGHNFSLSHDGQGTTEYYPGHDKDGSQSMSSEFWYTVGSWCPIMGASSGRSVSQWSKGEYYNSSNKEDDIAIIGARTGFVPDDVADTLAGATALTRYTNNYGQYAIASLQNSTDVDVFKFSLSGPGTSLLVAPYVDVDDDSGLGVNEGGNSDFKVELLNSSGGLMATMNPEPETYVTMTSTLPAGTYYLKVTADSFGNPQTSTCNGYTNYGSIGAYAVQVIGLAYNVDWAGRSGQVATDNGNGTYTSPWYGVFAGRAEYANWICSAKNGWQYIYPVSTSSGVYLWDCGTGSWWYTNSTYYPAIYCYNRDRWYYVAANGSSPNRQFYDYLGARYVTEAKVLSGN